MNSFHYWWWWHISRHWTQDAILWRLARWTPRKLALYIFIRVYACTGEAPTSEYRHIYDTWESQS